MSGVDGVIDDDEPLSSVSSRLAANHAGTEPLLRNDCGAPLFDRRDPALEVREPGAAEIDPRFPPPPSRSRKEDGGGTTKGYSVVLSVFFRISSATSLTFGVYLER